MSELNPTTREELFMEKAAGQAVVVPEPITREEMFLSMISPGDVDGVRRRKSAIEPES